MSLTKRTRKRFLDCTGMTIEEAEQYGTMLAELQRDIHFLCGDLARYAEARWPDRHYQVWPDWVSPGMLARTAGVCRAYPTEDDRHIEATYSQYMQIANQADRMVRLQGIVDAGQTTDESRQSKPRDTAHSWLLAFDIHYFAHRHYYSGAGVETAMQVADWVQRTVERLKEKGATDVVCAFEGGHNHRKELTAGPDFEGERYKDRPPKPHDLNQQLILVRELLEKAGLLCVSVDGYEADDVLASYAQQFAGKTTIISADKDLRQCLDGTTNILLDVEWIEDETSGDMLPEYQWMTATGHTDATGIPPNQWADYQCVMGDNVDGVKGVPGVGEKGAADLIKEFGTVEGAIQAAKLEDERINKKKREALMAFKTKVAVTRQLVTLRDDLDIPQNTRI